MKSKGLFFARFQFHLSFFYDSFGNSSFPEQKVYFNGR